MVSPQLAQRLLHERDVLALLMVVSDTERRAFHFSIETVEGPNNLANFSLGSASAQAVAGTGWQEIDDAAARYYLEPELENVVYHYFFGVSPGQAWVYRRIPPNVDIGSLIGTRAVGDAVGFVDGFYSPYRNPSPVTEMFGLKGVRPHFLGYHPYLEPASITVRLNFYIHRYSVRFLGVDPSGTDADATRVIAAEEARRRAVVRAVGGRGLSPAPTWLLTAMKR